MQADQMSYGRGRGSWGRGFQGGDTRREEMEVLEPSALIHVSELPEHTLEIDLQRTFSKFGTIKEICMLPHKAQALIEFDNMEVAKGVVERAKTEFVNIGSRRVKVNFSTSQHIVHRGEGMSGNGENKVLLFTVYNAQYPITVDILYQICSAHGRVCRIVIFRKFHLQAMIEFGSVEEATKAKSNLNGADIYSGCCTLKVEYAVPTTLTVTKNDNETWDYESPQSVVANDSLLGRPDQSQSLLKEPPADPYGNGAAGVAAGGPGGPPGSYGGVRAGGVDQFAAPRGFNANQSYQPMSYGPDMYTSSGAPGSNTPVLMVYGLNTQTFNCQRLFNLLCLYGNVVRVKFLRTMEGSAMVQMGDTQSVDRAVHNLTYAKMFGSKLTLCPSKQAMLVEVANPHTLEDGSLSFQDFSGSRNNRFLTPDMAMKNKIFPPFRTLYFWNCPPHYSDEQLREVFANAGCAVPEKILQFSNAKSADKTTAGLVQWDNEVEATEALVLVNNSELTSPNHQFPFAMRLSFAAKGIGERDSFNAGGVRDRSPFKDERGGYAGAASFRGRGYPGRPGY